MEFLEKLENGSTNIKRMGIVKALFVMFLSILLEVFGQVPVEITNLFSGNYEKIVPYVIFVFGVLVKYYVVIILIKWLSNESEDSNLSNYLNLTSFAYATFMIIGFRMIFDNSLNLWISTISMPQFINEVFNGDTVSPIISIFSTIVIAPIYEEIIFRGILLRGMARKISPNIALLVSALLFAVVHMNIAQGINAFFLGIVLGLIYLRSGSIYLSIFAHFINNLMALLVTSSFSSIAVKYPLEIHGIFLAIGMIFLAITCFGHNKNRSKNRLNIYKEFLKM
ncbi:CPBP family intramembrane glutamic endopeptidase [Clostridium psychrophilum]|uniref:CPBP family intramembrane glutamic endopeptidase n=1 Tax=Clostridium psychrophilum TaxID=132926 RepID=UPI001C0B94EF|nr:type II CAAX endopeptidase family protein [Clostridium psychrophilum]MBU3179901.1 CPBP family intramembrane metalloprotease [Clostridium psychrophilum]